ncbi:hypothetical protein [Undibacterium sp.]|uniref:hypothetical protein n=1 Tax=Undibacterium sp. TaxID=1914977 RepID=UPI00272AEA6F|nr:hypothetical protein [Undibacterium sp.]
MMTKTMRLTQNKNAVIGTSHGSRLRTTLFMHTLYLQENHVRMGLPISQGVPFLIVRWQRKCI